MKQWAAGLAIAAFIVTLFIVLNFCQPRPVRLAAPYQVYLPLVAILQAPLLGVVNLSTCTDVQWLNKAKWAYSYGPHPAACAGVDMVPMIQAASQMVPDASPNQWLLGFNEPDFPGWAQQTPADAAVLWRQIEAWYPDCRLVSPAPVSAFTYDPARLVAQFRDAYVALYGTSPTAGCAGGSYLLHRRGGRGGRGRTGDCVGQRVGCPRSLGDGVGVAVRSPAIARKLSYKSGYFWIGSNSSRVARYAWFGTRVDLPQDWYPTSWCDLSLLKADRSLTWFGGVYVDP